MGEQRPTPISPPLPPAIKSHWDCPREEDYYWFRMGWTAGHVSTGDSMLMASMCRQIGLIRTRRGIGGCQKHLRCVFNVFFKLLDASRGIPSSAMSPIPYKHASCQVIAFIFLHCLFMRNKGMMIYLNGLQNGSYHCYSCLFVWILSNLHSYSSGFLSGWILCARSLPPLYTFEPRTLQSSPPLSHFRTLNIEIAHAYHIF